MQSKYLALTLCLPLLLIAQELYAGRSVYQKQFGNREIEVELDAYYSNVDFYQPLTAKPIPCLMEENEFKIYRDLILSPVPRFIVAEISTNPLPWFCVLIRKNDPDLYFRTNVTDKLNLVQALGAGFEEPYAGSLFFGNVVSFRPQGSQGCEGKGYIGVFVSGGNFHIKDNELIDDNWQKAELRFNGEKISPERKLSWSFRLGLKTHGNPYIDNVFSFGIRRDRIDYEDSRFSFLKNSGIEYSLDIDRSNGKVMRHYFRVGKKFTVNHFKSVVGLNIGFVWEGADKYTGPLTRTNPGDNVQFLFQPEIQF